MGVLTVNLYDPFYTWFHNTKTHALPLVVLRGPNLSSVVLMLMIRVMMMRMTLYIDNSQSISPSAVSDQDHKNNPTSSF